MTFRVFCVGAATARPLRIPRANANAIDIDIDIDPEVLRVMSSGFDAASRVRKDAGGLALTREQGAQDWPSAFSHALRCLHRYSAAPGPAPARDR
jgi:hypothetical protein